MKTADPAAKVREVHPGIFAVYLPLPMRPSVVNIYLIRGGDEWAVVDTGMNSADSLATFRAALEQVGCPPQHVRKIICTHHHPDHYGASRAFKDLTGARLYIHPAEHESAQYFAMTRRSEVAARFFLANGLPMHRFAHVPSPGEFWASLYVPAPPDEPLADGQVIRVGDRELAVVGTPGHTRAHCVLHLGRERLMIAGDHLLPRITPHVGFYPNGVENPLGDFLASQRKIQGLDVELVLPAHGGVFTDHRHRARQIIQHHEARLREILDAVRREPRTGYEVACHVFGFDADSPITVQFPATFETLAHLEYLRIAGQVAREERQGLLVYCARDQRSEL